MARIAGVDLPRGKRIEFALVYIYGIGNTSARNICEAANVDRFKKIEQLTEGDISKLRDVIDRDYQVEGDLRREVTANIKRLMDLGCYRGIRHRKSLPVRGQRTHTNARTRKGKRRAPVKITAPATK